MGRGYDWNMGLLGYVTWIWDWEMRLVYGTGKWDIGLGNETGIWDWEWNQDMRLGIGMGFRTGILDWDLGVGFRTGISYWDLGTEIWDWDWERNEFQLWIFRLFARLHLEFTVQETFLDQLRIVGMVYIYVFQWDFWERVDSHLAQFLGKEKINDNRIQHFCWWSEL